MRLTVARPPPPHHYGELSPQRAARPRRKTAVYPTLAARLSALGPEARRIFTCLLPDSGPTGTGPLDGLAVSVKDNIDVVGLATTAGSAAFRHRDPAARDAPVIERLRAAGGHVFAKTNMSEFAYSTHGVNQHFGTPANPATDDEVRIPGGSSSGAGVAVARGLGEAAIGTDTAGSVRIPAALCGVVGLKPRQRRIPTDGVVPLSTSYDCVGVLAPSVAMTFRVFRALSDATPVPLAPTRSRYRLLVPTVMDPERDEKTSDEVRATFDHAIATLARDGRFEIVRGDVDAYARVAELTPEGGIVGPEAYAYHRPFLERWGDDYEPFTKQRLALGERCSAQRYATLLTRRQELVALAAGELAGFDAVIHPTCPTTAPRLADVDTLEALMHTSLHLLRYTIQANALDLPSLSLPAPRLASGSGLPIGLCLESAGHEEDLLTLAGLIEAALAG